VAFSSCSKVADDDVPALLKVMQRRLMHLETQALDPRLAALESQTLAVRLASLETKAQKQASSVGAAGANMDGKMKPHSSYSLCLELAMSPSSAYDAWLAIFWQGLLMAIQATLAFAFFDSSSLNDTLEDFAAYLPPVPRSNFYQGLTTKFCGREHGDASSGCVYVPTVSLLTSICGLLILVFRVRDGDHELLNTPFPLQLFWQLAPQEEEEPDERTPPWARTTAWRTFACAFMMLAWALRFYLLPVLIIVGCAMSLAVAETAQDVVLSVVAAGFLFELDSLFYKWIFSEWHKEEYQMGGVMYFALTTDSVDVQISWRTWRSVNGWCLWAVNIGVACFLYFSTVGPGSMSLPRPLSNVSFWLVQYMHARMLVYAAGQMWLQAYASDFLPSGDAGSKLVRCVVIYLTSVVSSFFTYYVIYRAWYHGNLGSDSVFHAIEGSELYDCLMGLQSGASCWAPSLSGFTEEQTHPGPSYTYGSSWYGAG